MQFERTYPKPFKTFVFIVFNNGGEHLDLVSGFYWWLCPSWGDFYFQAW